MSQSVSYSIVDCRLAHKPLLSFFRGGLSHAHLHILDMVRRGGGRRLRGGGVRTLTAQSRERNRHRGCLFFFPFFFLSRRAKNATKKPPFSPCFHERIGRYKNEGEGGGGGGARRRGSGPSWDPARRSLTSFGVPANQSASPRALSGVFQLVRFWVQLGRRSRVMASFPSLCRTQLWNDTIEASILRHGAPCVVRMGVRHPAWWLLRLSICDKCAALTRPTSLENI